MRWRGGVKLIACFDAAGDGNERSHPVAIVFVAFKDCYPYLVVAAKAWGQVALKGMSAIRPTVLKPDNINHANPLGMFGYVGASTWFNAVRINDAWMLRIECGVTAY